MAERMKILSSAMLLLAWSTAASAQLADPTRPPAGMNVPGEAGSGVVLPAFSGLQSVIMRKTGKPAALINGEIVELGGKVGEARLVKVSEDAVVLKGPGGEETLRLTPAVEKKMEKKMKSGGMSSEVGAGGTAGQISIKGTNKREAGQ